jgi:hypothetical protein
MPTGKVIDPRSTGEDPVLPFPHSLKPDYLIYSDGALIDQPIIYWPSPTFKFNSVVQFNIEQLELEYTNAPTGTPTKIVVDTAISAQEENY